MSVKIGCTSLVRPDPSRIVAIKCAKGRGLILPGGKYEAEKDKSFAACSVRELYEETGLTPSRTEYLWCGLNADGYFVYCFEQLGCDYSKIKSSDEGEVVLVHYKELQNGDFWPYYDTLFRAIGLI